MIAAMQVQTFTCGACPATVRLAVAVERRDGPRMDRFRLLASAWRWVIDLDGQAWCPQHRQRAAT